MEVVCNDLVLNLHDTSSFESENVWLKKPPADCMKTVHPVLCSSFKYGKLLDAMSFWSVKEHVVHEYFGDSMIKDQQKYKRPFLFVFYHGIQVVNINS